MEWTANDPRKINQLQNSVTIIYKKNDLKMETQISLDFALGLIFYVAIIVIFLMIIALIVKLMWNIDDDDGTNRDEERATENSSLLSSKDGNMFSSTSYGTSYQNDLESGKGSCNTSSEDLYDGQICVICYDDQRNCFFIPCGHCVTCYTCAKRIISEEMKTCPICRTPITKVRKLHIL